MRFPIRSLVALAVAATASAAAVGGAAPAVAGSRVVRDPAGDVAVVSLSDGRVTTNPALRRDDITAVRTSYGRGRVTVTAHLRAVRRNPQALAEIRTPARGPRYAVSLAFRFGHGEVRLLRSASSRTALPCAGLRMRAERARKRIVLSVPATCLGSPRWVRTGFAASATVFPSPAAQAWPGAYRDAHEFVDVAGRDGITERWFESRATRLPLGPKVHRD
jgi:hypothetical protein